MTKNIASFSCNKTNEREFSILDSKKEIKPIIKLGDIVAIDIGSVVFKIGDLWMHKKSPYKIYKIRKTSTSYGAVIYSLIIAPDTKSNIFILPMLGGVRKDYLYNKNYINCYLACQSTYKDYDKIILSYRFSGSTEFSNFESLISKHPLYSGEYEPDSYHINYVFDIPEQHKEDYKYFLDGKYSEFTEDYKKQILSFHNFTSTGSTGGILYKSKERREALMNQLFDRVDRDQFPKNAELLSIPLLKEETFLNAYKIDNYEPNSIGGIIPREI